jgi:sodium/potassium-transporting ATPase subunit alpha
MSPNHEVTARQMLVEDEELGQQPVLSQLGREDATVVFEVAPTDEPTEHDIVQRKSLKKSLLQATPGDVDDHYLSLDQLEARYNIQLDPEAPWKSFGLSDSRAAALLQSDGLNRLTPPKKLHPFVLYLHEFKNPLTILLLLAGILSLVLFALDVQDKANLYLGAVLIAVTLLNTVIEFAQLQKSAAILDSFNNLIPQSVIVIREGRQQNVPNENIVKGDLIYVRLGDKLPADARVVYASNFKVDNSSLTGESDPQARNHEPQQEASVREVEATNLAFGGTTVVSGEAYAIVIRCGDSTMLGKIAGLTATEKRKSPLTEEIDRLVRFITIASGVLAIGFFIIGMIINPSFSLNFNFLIGIFVANIPQGLPITVTLLLSFAVKRMAEKNVVVKDLQGVV